MRYIGQCRHAHTWRGRGRAQGKGRGRIRHRDRDRGKDSVKDESDHTTKQSKEWIHLPLHGNQFPAYPCKSQTRHCARGGRKGGREGGGGGGTKKKSATMGVKVARESGAV